VNSLVKRVVDTSLVAIVVSSMRSVVLSSLVCDSVNGTVETNGSALASVDTSITVVCSMSNRLIDAISAQRSFQ
jgi:hypothetical protein